MPLSRSTFTRVAFRRSADPLFKPLPVLRVQRCAAHPGHESDLAPEVLILAMILAAAIKSHVHCTIVCQIIDGMDSRIWHFVGMCSRDTRGPLPFHVIQQQIQRVEQFPRMPSPQDSVLCVLCVL